MTMKSVIVRLREYLKETSGAEKEVIDYIIEHQEEVTRISIHELASRTYTSASTIVRLCKKNSFKGFKELKTNLIKEIAIQKQSAKEFNMDISDDDDLESIVDTITHVNMKSLDVTRNLIDLQTLEQCIESIVRAVNIGIFGIGSSLIVAKDAQQKFMRINRQCFVYEDWHLQLLQAKNMNSNDIGIVISYSGETDEMIQCIQELKKNDVEVISITRYVESRISKLADHNIFVAANESTLRSGAMSSRISQLNIIDILYTACANKNYDESIRRIQATYMKKG